MKPPLFIAALVALALVAQADQAPTNSPAASPRYEVRADHDPNGIGKFYMGREIAHVMGHQAAANAVGNHVKVKIVKNKVAPPFFRMESLLA
jgi:hypothetical protein